MRDKTPYTVIDNTRLIVIFDLRVHWVALLFILKYNTREVIGAYSVSIQQPPLHYQFFHFGVGGFIHETT